MFKAASVGLLLGLMSASAVAEINVHTPYARATPPHAPNSAAFMEIVNNGDKDVFLLSASTAAANTVELHNHEMIDGMMKMRQVKNIKIPAGGMANLEPGGLHIMLFDLPSPLKEGKTIPLKLTFSDQTSVALDVPVKRVMAHSKMKHGHESGH
ncbi:copper chaperone PCu(A)C [Enterovibrio sp. ZSDZ35]|uniref:Copper chaperone PCu(A)C n=1 Tax=Enterovibrio qingdaonensis TaxID=2899818 RepID=A0ABT5QFH0_9GAMM|nr:copper chaperone PCu(A)C [Enterovibrio sp. ZSDZ35]MDD1779727.1 copper chaperone PCu(A)C [Enterovibrio sp. ZSDZ35]